MLSGDGGYYKMRCIVIYTSHLVLLE